MTNRKLHYAISIDTKIDDLELYKFEFSENFAGFADFGRNNS